MTTVNLDELKDEIAAAIHARMIIKRWTDLQKAAEERIAEAMGDATEGTVGGHVAVTYAERSRAVWDSEKLKRDLGNVAEEYRRKIYFRQFSYKDDLS